MKSEAERFASRLHRDRASGAELGAVVRDTLNGMLGELPTVAVLSYSGDATDGDFLGFATRMEELLGSGATPLLNTIVTAFEVKAPGSRAS